MLTKGDPLDFHQPQQFDLCCIGPNQARHRVVMAHRSVIGGSNG